MRPLTFVRTAHFWTRLHPELTFERDVSDLLAVHEPLAERGAVFGVPDADFGEAVAAAVVPLADAELDADAIVRGLEPALARFKLPRRIFLLDALPRNAMGKVQKNLLRERYG